MVAEEKGVSTFALIVDKLRMMDEAELKLAYIRLFEKELIQKWEELTAEANFADATDEEIIAAIQKKRREKQYV